MGPSGWFATPILSPPHSSQKSCSFPQGVPITSVKAISNDEEHLQRLLFQTSQEFHLTHREQEVLRLLIMGLTNKEMAGRMGISANTVKAFVRLVTLKMGTSGRSGIVAKVLLRALSLNMVSALAKSDPPVLCKSDPGILI